MKKNTFSSILLTVLLLISVSAVVMAEDGTKGMSAEYTVSSETYFPQEGDALFIGGAYEVWVDGRPMEDQYENEVLISIGLIPEEMEIDMLNAIWVVKRVSAMGESFIWCPYPDFDPDEDPLEEGKYSMVVIVDYGNPTHRQEQIWSEEFFLLSD